MVEARHILVIADSSGIEQCCGALANIPVIAYKIVQVKSGTDGLAYVKAQSPDCIMFDGSLLDCDGVKTLTALREQNATVPIVILVEQGNVAAAAKHINDDAQGYIIKSALSAEYLHAVISDALQFAERSREGRSGMADEPLVLIIDDNPDDRELCIRMLGKITSARYHFVEAWSEQTAVEKIAEVGVDCVLLDYSMPGRDGLDILKRLAKTNPHLPVIMMTGQGNEAVAVQAIKDGAYHYLVKAQLTSDVIHNAIHAAIEQAWLKRMILEREVMLAASEARFRTMYQNAPDAYFVIDLKSESVSDCNPAAEAMLVGTRKQILGLTLDQLSPEFQPNGRSSKEQVSETINAVLHNGTYRFDWTYKRITGELFPCDVNISLIDYDGNKVLLASWRDIAQQKQAEEALIAANMLNRSIMSSARHLMISTDPEGVVTSFNRASEQELGYTAGEIIGKTTPVIWHDQGEIVKRAAALSCELGRVIEPGFEVFVVKPRDIAPESCEWTFIRKDGSRFPGNLTATCIRNSDGRITGYLSVIEDISAFKEEERMRLELQQAMQLAIEGVSKIDARGYYTYVNNAYATEMGYVEEELVGEPWEIVVVEGERDKMRSAYREMVAKGKVVVETIGRRKDSSKLHIQVTMVSQYDGNHIFIGHFCFTQEITERKQQEELQQKLVEKLMESNTQLERFAYIASHDMQEPVRMVTNFSEIISKDYGHVLDGTGKEYLGIVVSSGRRMKDLVDDLLAYSRMGNEGMRMIPFNGASALAGVIENLKVLITEQDAVVTHDALPELYGNPVQFMRLLQNLITNGIKYQAKGRKPRIHIGFKDDGSHWCLSVEDNGLGIRPEFIEQIFQPFRRLHTWDQIQGTGLGLAICRKIVENHSGKIWGTSVDGKGSTFFFTILKHSGRKSEAA